MDSQLSLLMGDMHTFNSLRVSFECVVEIVRQTEIEMTKNFGFVFLMSITNISSSTSLFVFFFGQPNLNRKYHFSKSTGEVHFILVKIVKQGCSPESLVLQFGTR